MKGFNPNAKTFRKMIISALKSRKKSSVFTAMEWGYNNMGKKAVSETLRRYMVDDSDWLDLTDDDCDFFWEYVFEGAEKSEIFKEAMSKAKDVLVNDLVESGFTPGKDFSIDAKGQLVTQDNASEHILSHIPEHKRESFRQKIQKPLDNNPLTLTQIATNVGVHPDYFDRLLSRAKARLSAHIALGDIDYCLVYLPNLIEGTESKFPELKSTNFSAYILYQVFGESGWQRVKDHELSDGYDNPDVLCDLWQDIVNSTSDNPPETEYHEEMGMVLSTNYIRTLNLVWESTGKFPLREVIGHLTSLEAKHKRDNP